MEPVFPRGRLFLSGSGVHQPIILQHFCRKLRENELVQEGVVPFYRGSRIPHRKGANSPGQGVASILWPKFQKDPIKSKIFLTCRGMDRESFQCKNSLLLN